MAIVFCVDIMELKLNTLKTRKTICSDCTAILAENLTRSSPKKWYAGIARRSLQKYMVIIWNNFGECVVVFKHWAQKKMCPWVRSWRYDCLVTCFCYPLIVKPGNKTAAPPWLNPYTMLWLAWSFIMSINLNSSPPGQNGRHFTDNMFRDIFVNKNFYILVKISQKFVPKGTIDNNLALV